MRGQRITLAIRDVAPCKDCAEKFIGCHGKCPKDERGEFGYEAWRSEIQKVKAAREEYIKTHQR